MAGTKAIIYADQATANADLDWTYAEEGLDGNAIGIKYTNPGAASQALAVTYADGVVNVSLATDGAAALSTTGDALKLAILGVKAVNTLTSANTGTWTAGCTIVIGGVTYTGQTTLTAAGATPYEFLCETDGDTCIDNLVLAINAGAGAGTKYGTGTLAHSLVTAARSTHTMVATARHAGSGVNTTPTTQPSADVKITGWAETTLGGASATTIGVNPTIDRAIGNLFNTIADHSGHDGSGICAAMTVKYASSSGGTPGVNTIFDSATEMMTAGWILPDSSTGAVIVQNDQSKATAGANQITHYEASVYIDGRRITLTSDSAAHLREATKTYAIQLARAGRARCWAPSTWYSPALYSR